MRCILTVAIALCLQFHAPSSSSSSSSLASGEATVGPASGVAASARALFDGGIARARERYDREAGAAARRYRTELEAALAAAMRGGSLDEANRIEGELDRISGGAREDGQKPRGPASVAALRRYERATETVRDEFRRAVEASRRQYLAALENASRSALRSKDLEEANRIRAEIERVQAVPVDTAATPAARTAVNLLRLIDLERDTVEGGWQIDREGLTAESRRARKRLRLPYRPPLEYDYLIEFTVSEGFETGEVVQVCAAGDRSFQWTIGGGRNTVSGFEMIGGKGSESNPTTVRGAPVLRPGTRYQSVVRVRRDRVSATIDGREVAAYATRFADVDIRQPWLVGYDVLGLGTWNGVRFHRVEVVEVSGPGRPIRRLDDRHVGISAWELRGPVGATRSLLDFEPRAAQVTVAGLMRNRTLNDRPIKVGGEPCDRFLFAHAYSSIAYDVPEGATGFRAWAVTTTQNKSIECVIYVDGHEAMISRAMQGSGGQVEVSVNLPDGAKQIELRFRSLGSNQFAHTAWAYPEFVFQKR